MKTYSGSSIYKNIALDIANKILKGEIKIDEKLSGRTTLSSMYNVSPETIRRAIALLEDMNVVTSSKGRGIDILSVSAAEKFIEKYKSNEYMVTMKENIFKLIEKKKQLDDELEESFEKILDSVDRFKNVSPFTFIEIKIKDNCKAIGRTVNEIKFWQGTGATIVAYRRNNDIVISPGPTYVFENDDIIIVIGTSDVYERINDYLYNTLV